MASSPLRRSQALILAAVVSLIAAALVLYSQTMAFAWDEGFHILCAQMILHGKRPYIDFVFSQTPLNAYWNALWMAILGETWRVPHAIAALGSAAGVALISVYVFRRFPAEKWRFPGALLAGVLMGMNSIVFRFGGIAQAYGLCLMTTSAAFWLAILSPGRASLLFPAVAGFFAGTAAGSSLLSAPAGPVLLVWIVAYSAAGNRWAKCAAYLSGGLVSFAPILWLLAQGPRQVVFGIVDYNLKYRQLDWPDATRQNLEVMVSWIDSGPALVLLFLGITGTLYVRYQAEWAASARAEFYLCSWLAASFGLYISYVRPTFERYYLFAVPFLSILSVAGVYCLVTMLCRKQRTWLPLGIVSFLILLGLGKQLYEERDAATYADFELVAKKVVEVTPADQPLFADEVIYFLTKHPPPNGMEMWNAHKFNFTPDKLRLFHLIPQDELDRSVAEGKFYTLETCEEDDFIREHGYSRVFDKVATPGGCTIYWGRKVLNSNTLK